MTSRTTKYSQPVSFSPKIEYRKKNERLYMKSVDRLCWFLLMFFNDWLEFCIDLNESCSDFIRSLLTGAGMLPNFRSTCLFIDDDVCSELQNIWYAMKLNANYTLMITLITWDIFNNQCRCFININCRLDEKVIFIEIILLFTHHCLK